MGLPGREGEQGRKEGGGRGDGKAKASKTGSRVGPQMAAKGIFFSSLGSDRIQTVTFIYFRSNMVVKMESRIESFERCHTSLKCCK